MEEVVLDRPIQRTRKAAVGAFIELLMAEGYDAVAMTAVAERADPGRSTLYGHFRTKDDLLAASMDWPLRVLAARIVPGLRARGVAGPRAEVRALACAEGQFAALGLWMQGAGVPAAVPPEELARLAAGAAAS